MLLHGVVLGLAMVWCGESTLVRVTLPRLVWDIVRFECHGIVVQPEAAWMPCMCNAAASGMCDVAARARAVLTCCLPVDYAYMYNWCPLVGADKAGTGKAGSVLPLTDSQLDVLWQAPQALNASIACAFSDSSIVTSVQSSWGMSAPSQQCDGRQHATVSAPVGLWHQHLSRCLESDYG